MLHLPHCCQACKLVFLQTSRMSELQLGHCKTLILFQVVCCRSASMFGITTMLLSLFLIALTASDWFSLFYECCTLTLEWNCWDLFTLRSLNLKTLLDIVCFGKKGITSIIIALLNTVEADICSTLPSILCCFMLLIHKIYILIRAPVFF